MTISKSDRVGNDKQTHLPSRAPRRLANRLVERLAVEDKVATEQQLLEHCEELERQLDEKTNQLQAMRQNLEQSNEGFQQFANAVSHDLQTPLRAVSGFSQFLQQEYQDQLDDTANGYINRVVEGASRMEQHIKGLTLFSRVTSKAAPFTMVNLNEILKNAVETLQDPRNEPTAEVTTDELPTVFGDRSQLTLLLKNLIDNSLKYRSSSLPVIQISAKRSENGWTIAINDNGIGIAKEHQECVFSIFRRLHVEQKYEGVGAGLAICRRIVERHSGQIWVRSEEDKGSTFYFTIPLPSNQRGGNDNSFSNPTL